MLLFVNGSYIRPTRLHRTRGRCYVCIGCPFCHRTFLLRTRPLPEQEISRLDQHLVLAHPWYCKVCSHARSPP
jgi:hypothetical protein